jgi:hypothetical protein
LRNYSRKTKKETYMEKRKEICSGEKEKAMKTDDEIVR